MDAEIETNKSGIHGEQYFITGDQITFYKTHGYLHLPKILLEEEVKTLEQIYNEFIQGNVKDAAKDTSDMTGGIKKGASIENYQGIIVMHPSKYSKKLEEHVFGKRAKHVATQLMGGVQMGFDMDRFLAKRPKAPKAEFKWHQDQIYLNGPEGKQAVDFPEYETLILFVELDDTNEENGCIHYVVGSHKEMKLRPHVPSHPDVQVRTISVSETVIDESKEKCVSLHVKRGDMVIHNNKTIHKSAGNTSGHWRRTYVSHFCPKSIMDMRKEKGVTPCLIEC